MPGAEKSEKISDMYLTQESWEGIKVSLAYKSITGK